ncbi:hypothetical protein I4U23_019516 [Adineta vaga]|nr:hypothetical protein I4U23_019516 [Adineta vaga]
MYNLSLNISSSENLKLTAIIFTSISIILAFLNVLFISIVLFRLIFRDKFQRSNSKNINRRIGILYSIDTYIHIIGETCITLIMVSRTLYSDIYYIEKKEDLPSWHCRLLNYFVSMFASGIYGSCFLQALFRFWRIMTPHKSRYRTFKFHFQLVIMHWICISLISIPVWFRAIYLSTENYCFNRFSETWMSIYISITSVAIPISGIIVVYLKIVMYMKHTWQTRKRWKQMERDLLMIKRMLLLVIVLSNTSGAAVLLWLLMAIQKRLHPLSYRLLCFIIIIGLIICSITLLVVSPQLKRALQLRSFRHHHRQKNDSNKTSDSLVFKTNNESSL